MQKNNPQNSAHVRQVVEFFLAAELTERKAIIKHIDSFIRSSVGEQKIFWLRVRYGLERANEIPFKNFQKSARSTDV